MKREDFFKQYQTKEWYEISKRIKARDHNTCQMCGRNDVPLNVHHLYYPDSGKITDVNDASLITLCENCHYIQSESKVRINPLLKRLRLTFTDYEIYCTLRAMLGGRYNKEPYPHVSLEAIEEVDYKESKMPLLECLNKWRNKIIELYHNEQQG